MTQISPLYALALRWEKENGDLFSKETLELYDHFIVTQIDPFFEGNTTVSE